MVVGIIGILAGGIIVALDPAARINMSRDGVRKSDLRQIQSALEMYRSDLGSYPPDNGAGAFPSCGIQFDDGTATPVVYMKKVPCDPTSTAVSYTYTVVGSGYTLRACLQNAGDPDRETTKVGCAWAAASYMLTNP